MNRAFLLKRDRYEAALKNMPPSGGGGCHTALLRVANFGRQAGLRPDQVARDLAGHVHGTRAVTEPEIRAAVTKAFNSSSRFGSYPYARTARPRPVVDGAKLLKKIVERGVDFTEVELWEASRERINWLPQYDAINILQRLYAPGERLFIGSRVDAGAEYVLPASEWIDRFGGSCPVPEHIIPNPLVGAQGLTQNGKASYRADSCVVQFRFAVIEFDTLPRELQIQFWAGVKLPVVALIDSGGKSVHGWIRIDASDGHDWTRRVERKLFDILIAVGADGACKNEARLSRMPGHFRVEKGRWQRLLYLDPEGRPVIS